MSHVLFETKHQAGTRMTYHRHDAPYVTVVLEGSYAEVTEDRPQAVHRGSVVVHRPGEEHADHFTSATRCLNFNLSAHHELAAATRPLDGSDVVQRVMTAYQDGDWEGMNAALELLRASLRSETVVRERPGWLDALHLDDWIDDTPLRSVAARCGVHATHFSREFRRYAGMTPSAYRRRARIERASKLLLATDRPLSYVSLACGFADQSHFNRAFAIELGMSPGRYRRSFAR